jgi:hypothetical protein
MRVPDTGPAGIAALQPGDWRIGSARATTPEALRAKRVVTMME